MIAFPQMVMIYKDEAPKVDSNRIEINLPAADGNAEPPLLTEEEKKQEASSNDDIMKALGGKGDDKPAEPTKEEEAADDIMKALGGKPAPPAATAPPAGKQPDAKAAAKVPAAPGKSRDQQAAEEIEKALKGLK